jgi:osmotically-inducible protein OsmY
MFAKVMAAALVVLSLSAPAFAADKENLQLFRDVQRQVLRYPHFTIFDSVQAEVDNGVVTLVGKVTMPYKRTDIERRVVEINGVRKVRNQIEVLPVSQFDDDLRLGISRAIYGNSNFWNYASMVNPPIHIIVERGHVTLEGVVNSNVDRALARSLASGFTAFSITNNLKTDAEVDAELEKL